MTEEPAHPVGSHALPEDLLWHYTGFSGLQGIIEQREIWASDLIYLNDTTEFSYTVGIFASALTAAVNNHNEAAIPLTHQQLVFQTGELSRVAEQVTVFTACFSRARDDLSQWRAFGGRPPGFSIGFDPNEITALAKNVNFVLMDCTYDPAAVRRDVEDMLRTWIKLMQEHEEISRKHPGVTVPSSYGLTAGVYLRLMQIAQISKHPSFSAEREVRLVGSPSSVEGHTSKVRYRQSGSLVVPHVGISLAPLGHPLPIKAILVGPCPHQAAVVRAIERFVGQHQVRAVVNPSSVPFRNW